MDSGFKRVFVTGMFLDDYSFFDEKEEHVWILKKVLRTIKLDTVFNLRLMFTEDSAVYRF